MGMWVKREEQGEEEAEQGEGREADLHQSAQCYFVSVFFYSYMYLWHFISAALGFCCSSGEKNCQLSLDARRFIQ